MYLADGQECRLDVVFEESDLAMIISPSSFFLYVFSTYNVGGIPLALECCMRSYGPMGLLYP